MLSMMKTPQIASVGCQLHCRLSQVALQKGDRRAKRKESISNQLLKALGQKYSNSDAPV